MNTGNSFLHNLQSVSVITRQFILSMDRISSDKGYIVPNMRKRMRLLSDTIEPLSHFSTHNVRSFFYMVFCGTYPQCKKKRLNVHHKYSYSESWKTTGPHMQYLAATYVYRNMMKHTLNLTLCFLY